MILRFLNIDQVISLHQAQAEQFGGSRGVRDQALLESALAQPEASFGGEFVHKNLYEMAAAYLFQLVQNHPFRDGNKRIGALAAAVFLHVNGLTVVAEESEFEALVMATARGEVRKPEISEFFRANTKPLRER